jgi:hypothetical protein
MLPECPHMGYTMIFLSTVVLSTLTYYVYSSTISLHFLDDTSIELPAKIEYLKTSLDFWKTATITGMAAYLAFAIAWVNRVKETVAQFITNPEELFTLGSGVTLLIILFSIGVVVGPVTEALRNMKYLRESFKRVRSSPNQGVQGTPAEAGTPDA